MRKILLLPDPQDGGEVPPVTDAGSPAQGQSQNEPAPAPPPAAETVNNGRSEREVSLEAELAAEKARVTKTEEEKREREMRINQLEDENRTLKQAQGLPTKQKKSGGAISHFFGWEG